MNATMHKCMPGMKVGQGGGGYELLSDFSNSRRLCREGKLQEAMACLENGYNDCASQNSRAKTDLMMMVNPGKWSSSIDNFCNNADYLAQNEECQHKIVTESSVCIQARSSELQHRVTTAIAQVFPDQKKMHSEILRVGCSFSRDVLDCLMTPLEWECPCRYQRIIRETVVGVMPPFCQVEANGDDEDAECVADDEETSSDDGFSVESDNTFNWGDDNNNNVNNNNNIDNVNSHQVLLQTSQQNRNTDSALGGHPVWRHPAGSGASRVVGENDEAAYRVQESVSQEGGDGENSSPRVASTACFIILVSACAVFWLR